MSSDAEFNKRHMSGGLHSTRVREARSRGDTRGYLLAEPDLGAGHWPHLPRVALLAAQGPGLAEIRRVNVETNVTALTKYSQGSVMTRLTRC